MMEVGHYLECYLMHTSFYNIGHVQQTIATKFIKPISKIFVLKIPVINIENLFICNFKLSLFNLKKTNL